MDEEGCKEDVGCVSINMIDEKDKKKAIRMVKLVEYKYGKTFDYHLFREFFGIIDAELRK